MEDDAADDPSSIGILGTKPLWMNIQNSGHNYENSIRRLTMIRYPLTYHAPAMETCVFRSTQ
jgi:hypothetical protein